MLSAAHVTKQSCPYNYPECFAACLPGMQKVIKQQVRMCVIVKKQTFVDNWVISMHIFHILSSKF